MSSTVWILALIAPVSLHHTARGMRCLMISLFYNTVVLAPQPNRHTSCARVCKVLADRVCPVEVGSRESIGTTSSHWSLPLSGMNLAGWKNDYADRPDRSFARSTVTSSSQNSGFGVPRGLPVFA